MPFADPTSLNLSDLARRRAEMEALQEQMTSAGQMAAGGITGGLEKQEAMRVRKLGEERNAAKDALDTEEARQRMRISGAQEARAASKEATEAPMRLKRAGILTGEPEPTFEEKAAEAFAKVQPEEREPGEAGDEMGQALGIDAADILRRAKAEWAEPVDVQQRPEPTSGFAVRPTSASEAAPKVKPAPTTKDESATDWEKIDKQDARKLRDAKTNAVGAVESAKAMLAILDDPEQAKFIGKYRGALETLKEDVGIGSEASGIRAGMAARFNEYKQRISGAAVSDKEKPDLTRVMPDDIDINPDDLRRKLLEGIRYAERQRDLTTKVLGAGSTKVLDESQAQSPAGDHQAAFLKIATDLAKQLGRKPTKEELQSAMRAAGVLE